LILLLYIILYHIPLEYSLTHNGLINNVLIFYFRCVLSRNGEAIEMSHDHKPESEEETLRIVNAGGKITEDGRVNGGLNLSRAIGDHSYKANPDLPPEEQMISPMPTIQQIEIDRSLDDFMVLACDGVWNSLSSQEVVDFVAERIGKAPSLSSICEEVLLVIFFIIIMIPIK